MADKKWLEKMLHKINVEIKGAPIRKRKKLLRKRDQLLRAFHRSGG